MSDRRGGVSIERYSLPHRPGFRETEEYGHYTGMLIDDIGNHVVPYGPNRRRGPEFVLDPGDDRVAALLLKAFTQDYNVYTVHDACADWIRACAGELASAGVAMYELQYMVQHSTQQRIGFRLGLLDCKTVHRQGDIFVQVLPEEVIGAIPDDSRTSSGRCVVIPTNRVLRVEMPGEYRNEWRRLRPRLAYLDAQDPGERIMAQLLRRQKNRGAVDFDQQVNVHERAVAEVTRSIGWNARRIAPAAEGYYWMVRHLRWKRFLITLRDHLLGSLNDVLRRVGGEMGVSGRLVARGFPELADVAYAEAHLISGKKSFTELTKPFDVA